MGTVARSSTRGPARRLVVAAAAVAFAATVLPPRGAAAAPAVLPLAEVRPGMRGEARTVVKGVEVETFAVEVVDIVPRSGPSGDLILIRASGPLIRRTGGIAAGMSGSPVFLRGRLAGAIGFGWNFADHTLGLVTPIEAMLKVLPPPASGVRPLRRPVALGGRRVDAVAIVRSPGEAARLAAAHPTVVPMVPLAQPLLVSAVSPRAATLLQRELGPLGITPVTAATGAVADLRPPLVPGSAVGAQVARGDVNAVAIGTLTYRDGARVLAFGHQFLNRGQTAYVLVPATIHHIVRSAAFPFKIGSAGAPMGILSEDRRAGLGGRIGVLPRLVGVRVRVADLDRGETVTLTSQVVADAQLGPLLALITAIEAVDRGLDRVGEGTARIRLELRGRGLDGPLVRENAFYHPRDIGSAALLELPEALRLLFANEFVRTVPADITLDAAIGRQRQTATITEVAVERTRAARGGTIVVRVGLRPFQGPPVTQTVTLQVPEEFPVGGATVVVRAGGRPIPDQALPALLATEPVEAQAGSATAQLASFAERDRNTDLIVELIPGAARIPDGIGAGPVQTVRLRTTTSWVVRGRHQVPVTIDPR